MITGHYLDQLVRLDESFRARVRVKEVAQGAVYCGSCGGRLVSHLQPTQGRGYGCRKDENPDCEARLRIVAEPLEAYIEAT